MVKLVDTRDLKSLGEIRAGSIPVGRTKKLFLVPTIPPAEFYLADSLNSPKAVYVLYSGFTKIIWKRLIPFYPFYSVYVFYRRGNHYWTPIEKVYCTICGKEGHQAYNCPMRKK